MKLDLSVLDGVSIDERTKSNLISQIAHQSATEELQSLKEFSRYKQDCRKRALDLAHENYTEWFRVNKKLFVGEEPKTETETPMPNVLEKADEYYNWLISIQ